MSKRPLVSIIIPMRNEECHIGPCLDAILANDYPHAKLEIIVVDGQSEDRSRQAVQTRMRRHAQVHLLDNPHKITPAAMNLGILASHGDVVCMLNAHARISPTFINVSVQTLRDHPQADAVGGLLVSVNSGNVGKAIALALNAPLGTGGARYRGRRTPGPIFDTVPYAVYRRRVFAQIGLIDEELIRNQDAEFNYRLVQHGGTIYFNPDIVSYLHSRDSLGQLAHQQFWTGYWKVRLFQKRFLRTNWRHLVPAAFVGLTVAGSLAAIFSAAGRWLLIATLGAYTLAVAVSSLLIGRRSGMRYLRFLPWTFGVLHASYGTGTITGLWRFVVRRSAPRKMLHPPPVT
jgi:glycosyltransferase involved in cell wall biosynthesis